MSSAISIPGIEENYLNFNTEIKSSVQGRYKWEVLYDPTTSILEDNDPNAPSGLLTADSSNGWHPNLILDSGLDKLARMATAQVSQWCEAGTGDKPTKVCYDGNDQGVYVVSRDSNKYTITLTDGDNINIPWDNYQDATALAIFINIPELTKEHEGSLIYWQGNKGSTSVDSSFEERAQFKIKFINTYEGLQTLTGSGRSYQFAVVDTDHVNFKAPGNNSNTIDWFTTDSVNNTPTDTHDMYQFYHLFTQQTELESPYKMSQFYVEGRDEDSGSIFCGTEVKYVNNDSEGDIEYITFTRTYDFYMELTPVTYKELGWMESPAAETLFSRIVLDKPIHLVAGQFLRVSYQLKVTPTTSSNEISDSSLDPNSWGGNRVQIGTEGGWETDSDSDLLKGLEKIQHIGMCIVTDTGVAEPYDESGLSGEIFASGSSHFGPGYGYPNRWRTGTLPRQHPASATATARAINPFTGNRDAYVASSVERTFPGITSWKDTTSIHGWINKIIDNKSVLFINDVTEDSNAVIFLSQTWHAQDFISYDIDNATQETLDTTVPGTFIFYDIYQSAHIIRSTNGYSVGYLSEGAIHRYDLKLATGQSPDELTLTVPVCAVSDLFTNLPDPDDLPPPGYIGEDYEFWAQEIMEGKTATSGVYPTVYLRSYGHYGFKRYDSVFNALVVPVDRVVYTGRAQYWSTFTTLYGTMPMNWTRYGQADASNYINITGKGMVTGPKQDSGYFNTYVASKNDKYHSSWVGAMFNTENPISNIPTIQTVKEVYTVYKNTYHTINCDIDLTGIKMRNSEGNAVDAIGGGPNTLGAAWRNVGGQFVKDSNNIPTIKAEIIRKYKVKDGLLKNGVATDRLGQKLSSQFGHPLSIMPKSFFGLNRTTTGIVTGGDKSGVTFYNLDTDFNDVFEPVSDTTIDISHLLEFNVTVNDDGTLNITNTKIDPKLYTPGSATGPSDITLYPGDEIKLTLENYIVAGKITNAGPVWEYNKPDENPHILGSDALSPPYLRPIYQNSPLKNYLPRVKNNTVYGWSTQSGVSISHEIDALEKWTNLSNNVGQQYTGAVTINKATAGGGSGFAGSLYVKPALTGISTYYNKSYVSDFMEPVIKYDPLEQSLGAMWDPVAPDPSFVPQPSQLDTETKQDQIWIIDKHGVGDGQVKWPTYYDVNNTGDTVPVYISADPNDDSVLYITTSALNSTFQFSNDVFPIKSELPLEKTLDAIGNTNQYTKLKNQEYYQLDDIIRYEVEIKGFRGTTLTNLWQPSYTETFELLDSTRDTLTVSTKHLRNADNKVDPDYLNSPYIYNTSTGSLTANDSFDFGSPESPFTFNTQSTEVGLSGWQDVEITIKRVVGARARYNRATSNVVYWPNWNMPNAGQAKMTGHALANNEGDSPASRLAGDPVPGASIFLSTVGALDSDGNVIDDNTIISARKLRGTGSFSGDKSGREFPLNSTDNTALTAWADGGTTDWDSVKSSLSGASIETPLYLEPYKPGSCKLVKHGQFESSFANRDDWCVLGIGPSTSGTIQDMRESFSAARWPHYVFLFDTKQEKLNTHMLRATFEYIWDRDVALS